MLKNYKTKRTGRYMACLFMLIALCASQGYSTSPIGRKVYTKGLPAKGIAAQAESLTLKQNGKIAFVAYTGEIGQIFTMNPDGSERTQITIDEGGNYEPAWWRDGAKIAFVKLTETGTSIYVMNADGTDQVKLTDEGRNPSWSPDGSRIVFNSLGIVVMNADGSNSANITNNPGDAQPAWSPDGLNIAFVRGDGGQSNLHLMNPDGSNQRKLTRGQGRFENSPAWSPDGAKIAFTTTSCVLGLFCVSNGTFVINSDGSGEALILDADLFFENYSPAWSPDGKRIAFTGYQERSRDVSEIFTVNTDGTNLRNLTNSTESDEVDPSWQPAAQPILSSPRIKGVSARGKKLFITGERFEDGAVVLLNDEQKTTKNDIDNPATRLIAKKALRNIAPGESVTLRVLNPDGGLSEAFHFTRPID